MRDRIKLTPELILAVVSGVLVLVFIIFLLVSFLSSTPSTNKKGSLVTPTTSASEKIERTYPQAAPQQFYSVSGKDTGSLVVSSRFPDISVTIDEETTAEAPAKPVTPPVVPVQHTPFRIEDMPVGNHVLRATKDGYLKKEVPFVIRANTVTRLTIELEKN